MQKLHTIQYLRGIAAMLVVIAHFVNQINEIVGPANGGPITFPYALGSFGVLLFFAISGFIIVYTTHHKAQSAWSFLKNRFLRIVPLYWFYTLLFAGLATVVSFFGGEGMALSHVVKSLFFIPHYHYGFPAEIWPVVIPGWSLNYEMFFYLLFAAAMAIAAKKGAVADQPHTKRRLLLCSGVLGTLLLAGLIASPVSAIVATYTSVKLLAFLLGMGTAWLFMKQRLSRNIIGVSLMGAGVAYGLTELVAMPSGLSTLKYALLSIAGGLIVYASAAAELHRKILRVPLLLLIGDASYSIYLSHNYSLSITGKLWELTGGGTSMVHIVGFSVLALTMSVVAGIAGYFLLERPLLRLFRRKTLCKAPPVMVAANTL